MDNLSIEESDTVLVLGATGFIGSRLIPELRAKGIYVRMVVRIPEKEAVRIAFSEKTDGPGISRLCGITFSLLFPLTTV